MLEIYETMPGAFYIHYIYIFTHMNIQCVSQSKSNLNVSDYYNKDINNKDYYQITHWGGGGENRSFVNHIAFLLISQW